LVGWCVLVTVCWWGATCVPPLSRSPRRVPQCAMWCGAAVALRGGSHWQAAAAAQAAAVRSGPAPCSATVYVCMHAQLTVCVGGCTTKECTRASTPHFVFAESDCDFAIIKIGSPLSLHTHYAYNFIHHQVAARYSVHATVTQTRTAQVDTPTESTRHALAGTGRHRHRYKQHRHAQAGTGRRTRSAAFANTATQQ